MAVPAVAVKICGLTDEVGVRSAIEAGASYLGFVFVKGSKRYIDAQGAAHLLRSLPQSILSRFCHAGLQGGNDFVLTALFVNPTDADVLAVAESLCPYLGLIQLHGDETPERVVEIKKLSGLPVMKAIRVASSEDLSAVSSYEQVVDMLLFDAKVEGQSGGTGHSFDWALLKDISLSKPWMLAGGLNLDNARDAVKQTGAAILDVSSGVEGADGKKDPRKIDEFLGMIRK